MCSSAADCPKPPDSHCGKATCIDGACGLDLLAKPGELVPILSQIRGNCETRMCDSTGYLIPVQDGYDAYEDGKRCTIDVCVDGAPQNVQVDDGLPCPGGSGWCFKGECVECIATMAGVQNDCGPGNDCQEVYCVPGACGIMCGDTCAPCPAGYSCNKDIDCEDGVCGLDGMCSLPMCDDQAKNDGETDVDCGMATCNKPCANGKGCATSADCESGVCWAGVCEAPTCTDGLMNGKETGVDCGDSCDACP